MPTYTNYVENLLNKNSRKLEIINNGTLNELSPKIQESIPNLNITLKEHQKSLIYAALNLEKSSHTACLTSEDINYQTNIGIIADNVGSGKSIGMLGLISIKPNLEEGLFPNEYTIHDGWGIISFIKPTKSKIINTNVLLVPHTIINQWEKYIIKYTSLSYIKINSSKSSIFSAEKLETSTIVLVSNNFFPNFIDQLHLLYNKLQLIFDRFIIDEADNIKFGVNAYIKSRFTWFITSSLENLLFPSGCYSVRKNNSQHNSLQQQHENEIAEHSFIDNEIKYVHTKGLNYKNFIRSMFEKISTSSNDIIPIIKCVCIKHNDTYVSDSFKLPTAKYLIYKCITPYNIGFLSNVSNSESLNHLKQELMIYINANDISSLKEKLGFKVESCESISNMISCNLKKNLENEKKHYTYIESLDIDSNDKSERLLKITNKIKDLENSITHVLDRVNVDKNNTCPICCDNLCKPIASVVCCHRLFCMNCITGYFNTKSNKIGECPFCRTKIGFQGITIMEDSVICTEVEKKNILSKQDLFIKLILDNSNKKWLVFSEFDATFNLLLDKLKDNGISFSKICGSASHIDNIICNFNNGSINVLLLNAVNFGMGINLEMATDVLIYHKLSYEIEKQVIGRAQRPGRLETLNVHFLCHDNEFEYYTKRQVNKDNMFILDD
jgi:hypothetical protein